MDKVNLKGKCFELYIPEAVISEAVRNMAQQIRLDFDGKTPLLLVMLNGAFMFASDLAQDLDNSFELCFVKYSSYEGMESTNELKEFLPVPDSIRNRDIIIVEDIVDSGYTMSKMKSLLKGKGAKEVYIATLLYKPDADKFEVNPDYVGFEIPNDFIVGHGLDYDGLGRCYRDIYRIISK